MDFYHMSNLTAKEQSLLQKQQQAQLRETLLEKKKVVSVYDH